MGLLFLVIST